MALLQLASNNPNFSHIINKNPTSGMQVKSIRKGKAFGYFSHHQNYNIFFKDSDIEVSYKSTPDEQFEYVNTTRYNSPMAILNMITEFFASSVKKESDLDEHGHTHTLEINMMRIASDRVMKLANYMEDFSVDFVELAKNNYRVTITTSNSLRELLNFTNIFCLYATVKNSKDFLDINNDVIIKYINSLDVVDFPYIVRYIFKLNILHSRGQFNKYKEKLEKTSHGDIELTFGDSGMARRDWVTKNIEFNRNVIDIGCGEGFYVMKLAPKLKDNVYHAVDIDEECQETVRGKAGKRGLDNVFIHDNHKRLDTFIGDTVLLIEVIEHMRYSKAIKLVQDILKKDPNKLLITTPNKEFNVNYLMENEFRHDDHDFELTHDEFVTFISNVADRFEYDVTYYDIGDKVDGIASTQGAILERKSES